MYIRVVGEYFMLKNSVSKAFKKENIAICYNDFVYLCGKSRKRTGEERKRKAPCGAVKLLLPGII